MVEDKDTKNRFATENVYNSIKHEKTVGIIERNQVEGYIKVAAPLGVLAGIVPTTNPTSTTMFKILVALKTRNAIIFSFHPKAQKCSIHAAQILYDAALKAGAPKNIIQWIHKASLEKHHCLNPQPKDRFYFGNWWSRHGACRAAVWQPVNGGRGRQRCCLHRPHRLFEPGC